MRTVGILPQAVLIPLKFWRQAGIAQGKGTSCSKGGAHAASTQWYFLTHTSEKSCVTHTQVTCTLNSPIQTLFDFIFGMPACSSCCKCRRISNPILVQVWPEGFFSTHSSSSNAPVKHLRSNSFPLQRNSYFLLSAEEFCLKLQHFQGFSVRKSHWKSVPNIFDFFF